MGAVYIDFFSMIQGYFILLIIRGISYVLLFLPKQIALCLLVGTLRFIVIVRPAYCKIAKRNIAQVFPRYNEDQVTRVYEQSFGSIAQLIFDFIRGTSLTPQWIKEHVRFPRINRLLELKQQFPNQGIMILSGHLGSFEMLAAVFSTYGLKGALVARESNLAPVQDWWLRKRTLPGVQIIERTGAFRKLLKLVKSGENVGMAFDQNVTRNLAVFAPLFDRDAATSIAPAYVALENSAPVFVCAIRKCSEDNYVVDLEQCNTEPIYSNEYLSRDEKLASLTTEMNRRFEDLILLQPEAWFWMHRRWKTVRYEGERNIYR